jgi:sulfonate transport system permease protein
MDLSTSLENRPRRLRVEPFLPFLLPALILAMWEIATSQGRIAEYVLPSPRALVLTTWDFFWGTLNRSAYSGTFWKHALASSERVAVGFLLAAMIGVPLGLAAGSIRNVRRLVDMTIHAVRAVPGIGWLPLAIVWFGIGTKTTVFLISLAGFFPIYVNSAQGARHVRPIWKRAALMLGADRWSLFTTVILPGAMPSVVSGLRVALGLSWAYLVLGELTGVPDGLGAVIMDARMLGQVDMIIVGMISIALLGRLSDRLLLFLLRRLVWRREMV